MGYMKIENLYRCQDMLLNYDVLYALEKVHGTSAHISWDGNQIKFFAGGANHEAFVNLFDHRNLTYLIKRYIVSGNYASYFNSYVHSLLFENDFKFTLYGEAYGGKLLKMRNVYGELKFIGFDVKIGDTWLDVPDAEKFFGLLDLDFVPYTRVTTDIPSINHARDMASVVAREAGMGTHVREGIILRPIHEQKNNNGSRVIAKHKTKEYSETSSYRELDATTLKLYKDAKETAKEWVTVNRLDHVIDKLCGDDTPTVKDSSKLCKGMLDDIIAESRGEIEWNRETEIEILKHTGYIFREYLKKL